MILHVLAKLLLLLGLLLILQASVLEAFSLALPNCKEECGGITIPYPFGIGPGCFLEEWYEIDCRSSPASPVPVLKKANLEVISISLPVIDEYQPFPCTVNSSDSLSYSSMATINVSYPIISNASCVGNGTQSPVSLRGSLFDYSNTVFIAVGCDVHALLITSENIEYGCMTGDYNNVTLNGSCLKNTSWCDMETYISQEFQVEFTGGVEWNCTYALLVDSDWWKWQNFEAILDRKSFSVSLLWRIPANTSLASRINPANLTHMCYFAHSYSCEVQGTDGYFACGCNYGYHGNPYIENCEDIDECREELPHNQTRCPNGLKCVNRPGGYDCVDNWRKARFVLIGIGSALGALLLLFLIWRLRKFIQKRKELKLRKKFFKRNGGLLLQQQLNSPEGSLEKGRIFTMKDLAVSTDNFNQSRVLGHGGQGTVYKGMLPDGRIVAIKKSTMVDEGMLEQFINEVVILSQINHRNIVKLLGCCLETEVPLLVYEFIPNGTLFEYLHEANEELPVTWDARLRIAVEIAEALSYLHSAASIPIYHRDIKSTNILLDEKFRAKVADFGTSKSVSLEQTHVTTLVQGTLGYLDPEYFQTSQFTDKSDVYSFGVVLVELLTGQKPISSSRAEEGRSLATYFIISMEENQLFDILHLQVTEQATREEISRVANLANRCLHLHGRNRPTMKEIAAELEEVRNIKFPSGIMQCQKSNAAIKEHADGFGPSRTKADAGTLASPDEQPLLLVTTSW